MRMVSCIDPHVHLRGTEYDFDYIGIAFEQAAKCGLACLIEMPNPVPWLTSPEAVEKRIKDNQNKSHGVMHKVNIGITNDLAQVKQALLSVGNGLVVADKIFYTHSTGNMGILDEDIQRSIWELKGELRYNGVSMGHFEDEKAFVSQFDSGSPISHSLYQNAQAELVQVERQFRWACDYGFRGTFYVCHVSNPMTVDFLRKQNPKSFKIIIECTFHHMFLNYSDYTIHGNRVKMNPPLRSPDRQAQLLEHVLCGDIDIIGSDHAPHMLARKDSNSPPSGIPAIPFWPRGVELLKEAGMSDEWLKGITFGCANRIFNLGLSEKIVDVTYDKSQWDKYGYDPFSRF
jgi:dihydroorotase